MPHKHKMTAFLALGTNLGDRMSNLDEALARLPPAVKILKQSPIYETKPWGITDQPLFLNMVVQVETGLSPSKLLMHLKHIETEMGRTPTVRYGPRTIDMDILFYDDLILETRHLTIPHPRLHERAFVLVPLHDIAPDFIHPVLEKSIGTLMNAIDLSGVKIYG